ncbi:hypothetical protein SKAU_G00000790 [Synaphobranchus kaupii]|uniref:Uncharacterized protein n=1 Tax=Synaphobranchus kaupii TaxID=118154 RepID=A0A9Q1JA82_SYNKA|nr:hypothetical protein SKAU_G00000790 [Synaphobranchus kaupii]
MSCCQVNWWWWGGGSVSLPAILTGEVRYEKYGDAPQRVSGCLSPSRDPREALKSNLFGHADDADTGVLRKTRSVINA